MTTYISNYIKDGWIIKLHNTNYSAENSYRIFYKDEYDQVIPERLAEKMIEDFGFVEEGKDDENSTKKPIVNNSGYDLSITDWGDVVEILAESSKVEDDDYIDPRCISDDNTYLSCPPQNRCKKCGKFWIGPGTPTCTQEKPKHTGIEKLDILTPDFAVGHTLQEKINEIIEHLFPSK